MTTLFLRRQTTKQQQQEKKANNNNEEHHVPLTTTTSSEDIEAITNNTGGGGIELTTTTTIIKNQHDDNNNKDDSKRNKIIDEDALDNKHYYYSNSKDKKKHHYHRHHRTTTTNNIFQQLIKSIRRSLICCFGFWFTVLIITVIVILWGHNITCFFHKALCTPFSEYIYKFPMLPQPDRIPPIIMITPSSSSSSSTTTSSSSSLMNCKTKYSKYITTQQPPSLNNNNGKNNNNNNNKKLLFLIGESRGGSTFVYDTLNLHNQVMMRGGEPLYSFSNKICNNNLLLRDKSKCTFDNWLEALYNNSFYNPNNKYFYSESNNNNDDDVMYLGTKINIGQIPTEFYVEFIEFLHCVHNHVVVVHVTRAASIASYLNYQLEVPERIQSSDYNFVRSDSVPKPLNRPLKLDPKFAARWVQQRDQLSREIGYRIAFSSIANNNEQSSSKIKYIHYYYEQLSSNGGDDDSSIVDSYWNSLFSFLNINNIESITQRRSQKQKAGKMDGKRTANKTHGSTTTKCYQRISNWDEVKSELLKTTTSELSVIACENY